MNGTTTATYVYVGSVPTTWTIVGTGDFNGDAISDVLWRNDNGDVAIWLMNNAQVSSTQDFGIVPVAWSIVGTGDFNGDGISDVLWRLNTGLVAMWLMNGTQASTVYAGTVANVWTIQSLSAD